MKNAVTKLLVGLVALLFVSCAQSLLPVGDTYTITFQNQGNGSVNAKATGATAGTQISLAATPAAGWELTELYLNDLALVGPNRTNIFSITMPASNVLIRAVFNEVTGTKHTVTATQYNQTMGLISVSTGSATPGDIVSITMAPEAGYQVTAGSVKANNGAVTLSGSGTTYTFIMPDANVVVTGAFEVYVNTAIIIQAEAYTAMFGVQKESCLDVGATENIGWTDAGDWTTYSATITETASYKVEFRVASELSSGAFDFLVSGAKLASKTVSATGGWQAWTTLSSVVSLTAGSKEIKLAFTGGGVNFNWIKISKMGPSYAVTFNAQGGDAVASVTVPQNEAIGSLLPGANRTGFSLVGWYLEPACTTPFTATSVVSAAMTVYAKWQPGGSDFTWNASPIGPTILGIQTNGTVSEQKSGAWDSIIPPMSGMKIINNTWGIGSPFNNGSGSATIFAETVKGAYTFGWAWNLTPNKPDSVITYQEVGWGWSPNSGSWINGATPMFRISDNKKYLIDFDLKRTNRSGAWNTAFDIWCYPETSPTGGSGGKKGGYEVMIWFDHEVQGPWGSNAQNVTINGRNWKVYDNNGEAGWRVVTYIVEGAGIDSVRNYNVSTFLDDATSRYSGGTSHSIGFAKSHYVNAIEFGSESCGGQGMLEIANFKINVQ